MAYNSDFKLFCLFQVPYDLDFKFCFTHWCQCSFSNADKQIPSTSPILSPSIMHSTPPETVLLDFPRPTSSTWNLFSSVISLDLFWIPEHIFPLSVAFSNKPSTSLWIEESTKSGFGSWLHQIPKMWPQAAYWTFLSRGGFIPIRTIIEQPHYSQIWMCIRISWGGDTC